MNEERSPTQARSGRRHQEGPSLAPITAPGQTGGRPALGRSRLGSSDVFVSWLGLGTNTFGRTIEPDECFRILDRYVSSGGNFIDAAEVNDAWVDGHDGGESQRIIGDWLRRRGRHDDVVVATKVGLHEAAPGVSRDSILRDLDESLDRLHLDSLDVYYMQAAGHDTPLDETLGTLAELRRNGLVRVVGISNVEGVELRHVLRVAQEVGLPIDTVRFRYSLLERVTYETGVRPLAERHRMSLVGHSGLAQGLLTARRRGRRGRAAPETARGATVDGLTAGTASVMDVLVEIAEARQVSPGAVALAWAAGRPTAASALAGVRSVEELIPLLPALELELDGDECEDLALASAVSGPRVG